MNKLTRQERKAIIAALVEGNSIRATVRMTGFAKNTVVKLLADIGRVCEEYQDKTLRGLSCRTIQCDEIWSFCYAKAKNVPADKRGQFGFGDVWTWVAMDADTKLVASWLVGKRDAHFANLFMNDLAERLTTRVQLTTDGHGAYLQAVEGAFGCDVDYAMLMKLYGGSEKERERTNARYSPAVCTGARKEVVNGKPDKSKISTSYVERQNLTMRMAMRRFTRLTNAFSKKVESLECAVALHFMHYNFCRIHQSLRVSPAMAAGVTERLWEIEDIVALFEAKENSN